MNKIIKSLCLSVAIVSVSCSNAFAMSRIMYSGVAWVSNEKNSWKSMDGKSI